MKELIVQFVLYGIPIAIIVGMCIALIYEAASSAYNTFVSLVWKPWHKHWWDGYIYSEADITKRNQIEYLANKCPFTIKDIKMCVDKYGFEATKRGCEYSISTGMIDIVLSTECILIMDGSK